MDLEPHLFNKRSSELDPPLIKKEKDQRPKVIVYENDKKSKRKLLELKLVMVAEQ